MPETKLDLKNLGSISLMPLETTGLFLPFGRPIADYLRGAVPSQNGTRALLKQSAIDFSPALRWTASTAAQLRTIGFGEMEREGLIEPAAPATPDPGVADFLPFEQPSVAARESSDARVASAIPPEDPTISLPRISALPLRPRMTFGPPPAAKAKPAPATPPVAKPAGPPLAAAKTAAPPAAPPKPAPAPKPVAPTPVAKPQAASGQARPVATIPPAPKPAATPVPAPKPPANPRSATPAAPVARTAESVPAPAKPNPTPIRVTPVRVAESAVSTLDAPPTPVKPVAMPSPASKAPAAPPSSPKPPASAVPAGRTPSAKPESDAPAARPPAENAPLPSFEPRLSMGADAESGSFLEKIPMPVKIGIALLLLMVALYFVFGKGGDKPAGTAHAVGEQGWSTEWASDVVGSRRGRQITLYRPSTGMSDYQIVFTGQIETKALGWVFRLADTKNYYAMKLENLRPGAMALTHFAVVDGRESLYSQRPLGIDARPGAAYRIKLDVNGPRFTVSIGGEPVDFWTDNRLKTGSVGFMNEREERGATSAVEFSFPHGAK